MDTSVKALQEAISIRRQIENLEQRLASLLRGGAPTTTTRPARGRYFSPGTRAKLAAAARARWARLRGARAATPARKKGQLTPAGRRKLSQLMKARWAARRKAGGTKTAKAGHTMRVRRMTCKVKSSRLEWENSERRWLNQPERFLRARTSNWCALRT